MTKASEKKKGVLGGRSIKFEKRDRSTITNPIFVGIDPSFNGFGIVILDKDGNMIENKFIVSKPGEPEDRLIELETKFNFIQ